MRNAAILITLSVLLLGPLFVSGFMDREHRQRSRVSAAMEELHGYFDRIPNQLNESNRSKLGFPKHFHEDLHLDVSDMPDTIDFTIDIVGEKLVATFGKEQEDVSGFTVFMERQDSSKVSLRCGGTVPVKYLPMVCR